MKKLLIILFILICGVSIGQTWQRVDPTGVRYFDPATGTNITITPTSIKVTTNHKYTGVYTPTRLEITTYDSIGYFNDKQVINLLCNDTAICKDIYNFTTNSIGEFVFTIFGTPDYQSSHFIGYSIIIFTYRAQQKYEEYLKTIYR